MSDVKHINEEKYKEGLQSFREHVNNILASAAKDYNKALEDINKALEKAGDFDDNNVMRHVLGIKGYIHATHDNHHEALRQYKTALQVGENVDDCEPLLRIRLLNNIGHSNLCLSNVNEALLFHLQALELCEKENVKRYIAPICLNVGETFRVLTNSSKALEYYLRAADLYKEQNDNQGLAKALNDVGIIYENLKEYDKALEYYYTALDLFDKTGYMLGYAYALNNIGVIKKRKGLYEKALGFFQKSLDIQVRIGDKLKSSNAYSNIGEMLALLGRYDESWDILKEGLETCEKSKNKFSLISIYNGMVNLFSAKEEFEKALEYHKLYTETKDEIFKEKYTNSIAEMQVKYDAEKKEREATINYLRNVELEKKNKLIEEQKKKLESKNELLYKLAITDKLTQIYNRTYIMDILEKEFANTKRHNLKMSVILFDIDDFKKINDKYGHLTGDQVLRNAADKISAMLRKDDIFGRYGGEEFMIIMPNTDSNGALVVADKIRRNFQSTEFHFDNLLISITISFGIAGIKDTLPENITQFINYADHALYKAKTAGKNKAIVYGNRALDIGKG